MSKLTTSLAIAGLLTPVCAHALGVGDIKLQSYLNQPLRAEIPLVLSDEKAGDLKVLLAPPQDFTAAGIERPPILAKLRFDVARKTDGGLAIRVRSNEAIPEPYLTFLVEVVWPGGRILRNYTVLLDPPDNMAQPNSGTGRSDFRDAAWDVSAPVSEQTSFGPPSITAPTIDPSLQTVAEYGPVARREKLWSIAEKVKPDPTITQEQMVMALFRFNPHAFSRPSVNALNAGAVLRIPPRSFILELSPAVARDEFFLQQSGRRTQWSRSDITANSLAASGTAQHELEPNTSPVADTPRSAAGSKRPTGSDLASFEALKQDNAELRERVSALERRVSELQVLFSERELMAANGPPPATLQQQSSGEPESVRAESLVAPAPTPVPAAGPVASADGAPPAAPGPVTDQIAPQPPVAAAPVTSKGIIPSAATSTQNEEPTSDRWLYLGFGALIASLAGGLVFARRKKSALDAEPVEGTQASNESARSEARSTAALGSEDQGILSSSGRADPEEVDPSFEADIYLTYGKHAQARETMETALAKYPEQESYQLKLLQILVAQGDTGAFDERVAKLKLSHHGSSPSFWQRVAELTASKLPRSPDVFSAHDTVLDDQPPHPAEPADETERLIDELHRFGKEIQQTGSLPQAHPSASASSINDESTEPSRTDEQRDDRHEIPWVPMGSSRPEATGEPERQPNPPVDSERIIPFEPSSATPDEYAPDLEELSSESIDTLLKELSAIHFERQHSESTPERPSADTSIAPIDTVPPAATGDTAPAPAEPENQRDDRRDLETSLDLARAYADMGDHEQAEEFIHEVLAHGSDCQKIQAAQLLESLTGEDAKRGKQAR